MTNTAALTSTAPNYLNADVATIRFHAELRALEVLGEFWSMRLNDMPVDVTAVATRLGVKVSWGEMDDVEAFLYCPVGTAPEITVNADVSKTRKRFATAHELGHLMHVRDGNLPSESGFVDKSTSFSRDALHSETLLCGKQSGDASAQLYANSFAAALLLPRPAFSPLINAGWSDEQIAREFDVPVHAVQYRKAVLPGQTVF